MIELQEHYQEVQEQLTEAARKAGRDSSEIRLMAVSKTHGFQEMLELVSCGQTLFGENRVQEVEEKVPAVRPHEMRLHLIGHLQSNKAKRAISLFDGIDSIDSLKLATKLEGYLSRPFPVLLELKTAQEESKSGFVNEEALFSALDEIMQFKYMQVRGLMTIGPLNGDVYEIHKAFASLRTVFEKVQEYFAPSQFDTLSMGMSADYQIAIEEGSNLVRIGTKLFGKRG
ncbi:MAG: YggS family pyridoxal phosphate-dependent enzyme [Sphaerochaetaceae bacterium]